MFPSEDGKSKQLFEQPFSISKRNQGSNCRQEKYNINCIVNKNKNMKFEHSLDAFLLLLCCKESGALFRSLGKIHISRQSMIFTKSSVDTEEMEVLFIVIQMTIELLFPPFIFHSMPRNLVVLAISIMLMNKDPFLLQPELKSKLV